MSTSPDTSDNVGHLYTVDYRCGQAGCTNEWSGFSLAPPSTDASRVTAVCAQCVGKHEQRLQQFIRPSADEAGGGAESSSAAIDLELPNVTPDLDQTGMGESDDDDGEEWYQR